MLHTSFVIFNRNYSMNVLPSCTQQIYSCKLCLVSCVAGIKMDIYSLTHTHTVFIFINPSMNRKQINIIYFIFIIQFLIFVWKFFFSSCCCLFAVVVVVKNDLYISFFSFAFSLCSYKNRIFLSIFTYTIK